MDLAIVVGVVSLIISGVLTVVVFSLLRRDRKETSKPVDVSSPALIEAERIAESIGPLLEQVEGLRNVVVEGRIRYEARIAQLQRELEHARGKANGDSNGNSRG